MNAAAPRIGVSAAASVVTLACARQWPKALDGRTPRPIRGTWHPLVHRAAKDQDAPTLVPMVACPRCASPHSLAITPEAARVIGRPVSHAVDEKGAVTPELRCACGWYGPVVLEQWNRWQTLFCAVIKENGRALLRTIYTHAADAREATEIIIAGRTDRRLVQPVVAVIRNDQERMVLV